MSEGKLFLTRISHGTAQWDERLWCFIVGLGRHKWNHVATRAWMPGGPADAICWRCGVLLRGKKIIVPSFFGG